MIIFSTVFPTTFLTDEATMTTTNLSTATITKTGLVLDAAAIEVGFGVVKWAYRNSTKEIIQNCFPSLCVNYTKNGAFDGEHLTKRDTYIIPIRDQFFEVGPDVMLAQNNINPGRTLNDDFPTSDQYLALLMGAVTQMRAVEIRHLVLGLPVHTMKSFSQELKKKFTGTITCGDKSILIHRVSVMPQPVGTLVYASRLGMGIENGVNNLIIDPGYYSTDWVVANGFRLIEQRSGGKIAGVSPILKQAATLIANEKNVKFERFERLGEALKNGSPLMLYGQPIANAECWEYVRRSSDIVKSCLNEIETCVGDLDDIDSIILTGGGAAFYREACEEKFSMQVRVIEDSSFANCLGFLLAGENHKGA